MCGNGIREGVMHRGDTGRHHPGADGLPGGGGRGGLLCHYPHA
jgi:hypothetical protein